MWLSVAKVALPPAVARPPWPQVVVAIPARNEASGIADSLHAVAAAARRVSVPVTVVVGANNCTDGTVATARRCRLDGVTLLVEAVTLPASLAHAGGARRHVMDRAADLAGGNGVIMTTDADSRVDADWIAANLAELGGGADAVAGMVTFDAAARATLPALAGRALEWQLARLHARIEHLLDPRRHDPWPRHIWAWGASFALTASCYRAVGGVPAVPLAEDRALAEVIEERGFRLRRSYAPLVYTSARRNGRAPGGFADLLDSYASDPATLCDAALEPTATLVRRIAGRVRGRLGSAAPAALPRRRLHPAELAGEVARAERIIAALERRAARRADSPPVALAA